MKKNDKIIIAAAAIGIGAWLFIFGGLSSIKYSGYSTPTGGLI